MARKKKAKDEEVLEQVFENNEVEAEAVSEDAEAEEDLKELKETLRAKRKKPTVLETLRMELAEERELLASRVEERLSETFAAEFERLAKKEIRRSDRRRRVSNFFHDIVIVALGATAVFFGYKLYDIGYFQNPEMKLTSSEEKKPEVNQEAVGAGPVKDATWYLANYRYLYDNLQVGLDADKVSAYFLYSGDYKTEEIPAGQLLGMAYNRVVTDGSTASGGSAASGGEAGEGTENGSGDAGGGAASGNAAVSGGAVAKTVTLPGIELKKAFSESFGSWAAYNAANFKHGCLDFRYDRTQDLYLAEAESCTRNEKRQIVEQIEKIYGEGEVIYVVTQAGVYDKEAKSFYNFDNLFREVAKEVEIGEFANYAAAMNRYQYQFKRASGSEEKYYFAGITKLR